MLVAPLGLGSDIVVSGNVRHKAVLQTGYGVPTGYEVTTERYIVEAPPSETGNMIPLDHDLVISLCADKDGCYIVMQMVNWDEVNQPGNVASVATHLFLSETSDWWRLENNVFGRDDSGASQEWNIFDCYFSDAESPTGANQRSDSVPGFGLMNALGGSYSDTTTTCRVVLSD